MGAGKIDQLIPRALLRRPWSWRLAGALVGLALVLGGAYLIAGMTTEHHYWSRIVVWRDAAFDDFATKFEARAVPNGPTIVDLSKGASTPPPGLGTIVFQRNEREQTEPLPQLLKETETRAFLIVKGDQRAQPLQRLPQGGFQLAASPSSAARRAKPSFGVEGISPLARPIWLIDRKSMAPWGCNLCCAAQYSARDGTPRSNWR